MTSKRLLPSRTTQAAGFVGTVCFELLEEYKNSYVKEG